MTAPKVPRNPRQWVGGIVAVGVLVAVGWLAAAYFTARAASGSMGAVVSSIGRLEPFTRSLPQGSVVIFRGDTVAHLHAVVAAENGPSALRLWRGRWLASSETGLLADTTLVGFLLPAEDSGSAMVVRLARPDLVGPNSAVLGTMILEPGGRVIQVVPRSH